MPRLAKAHGKYFVDNPRLSHLDELELDNGAIIAVEVKVIDKRLVSEQQRKLIFATCHEIADYTGQFDKDYWRLVMQQYNATLRDVEVESLSTCSMTYASLWTETIISLCIEKEIPLARRTLDDGDYKFSANQTYVLTLKRMCIVCGQRADIHHVTSVGMGRNRDKISHVGMKVIPACRHHHKEAHTIGDDEFLTKYHITPISVDEKLEMFIKKGSLKLHKEDA